MSRLVFTTLFLLILFSILIGTQINAQDRRGSTRKQSDRSKVSVTEDIDPRTPEERKSIEECTTPDRPKPEVEAGKESPVLCGKAISLPKPAYPEEAKAQRIFGVVRINVVIDEKGKVIWARAVEGHPLLQGAALKAACQARYSPERISGRAIKVSTVISYNFLSQ